MTVRQTEEDLRAPTAVVAEYLRKSISISYLASLVWAGRLIVIAGMAIGLIDGIYAVYSAGPSYTATMKVSPAESDGAIGDLGAGSSGGAAGLIAGLTGTTGAVALPKFTQFIFSIGSVGVAQDLIKRYDMLCSLYKGDCDPITHQWHERTGLKEEFNALLAKLGGLPDPNGARTDIDLADYVANAVVAETNKANSLVTLSYTTSKPGFAAKFLTQVVATTNDHIRAQSRETQKRYVEYLTQSATKTANVEQRQAIDTLLLQEERQLMMTEVDTPYAAKILDGPTVTPVNNIRKIILIHILMGLAIGMAIAASRDLLPRKWRVW